jgi:hypothetical protein
MSAPEQKIQAAEILESAAFVIRGGFWTRFNFARNKNGKSVCPLSSSAVCWCGEGAIEAASKNDDPARKLAFRATTDLLGTHLHRFNDAHERTADEVADAMEKAAAKLRAEVGK